MVSKVETHIIVIVAVESFGGCCAEGLKVLREMLRPEEFANGVALASCFFIFLLFK